MPPDRKRVRNTQAPEGSLAGADRRPVSTGAAANATSPRIFLLSPANAGGPKGRLITSDEGRSLLAQRLRREGLPLGEVFTFISGLYFRGKLAYARAFALVPQGALGTFVITAGRGLVPPEQPVTLVEMREMSSVPVDAADPRYRLPLERDAKILRDYFTGACEVVLLGSIATPKYIEPLLAVFGERLLFPAEFVGRGDMSRGGLMLRCVRAGVELTYVPVATAVRHGCRPPKLHPVDVRRDLRDPLIDAG